MKKLISLQLFFYVILSVFFLSSCTNIPAVQGRVRGLASKGDFDYAAQFISRLENGVYGENNRLLESLDRGMIYHYAGQYQKSIEAFEDAKIIYDELYTRSLSKIAVSWLWNDSSLPYPGEDFERVTINIFQALNFIALEEYDDALVEARNVQSVLQLINDRYPADKKNVYGEDAFARMLMGMIYEAYGERQDYNNAFIAYRKSENAYDEIFAPNYSIVTPDILKENILSAADWMGRQEFLEFQHKFPDIEFLSFEEKKQRAEVYLICYRRQIVNKTSSTIILPGMDGLLTRISFPKYRKSFRPGFKGKFRIKNDRGEIKEKELVKVHDFDAIARQNLKSRKIRILAKAVARPLTKQLLVEALEDKVNEEAGETAGDIFNYVGNFYLLYSEQADLRAWETLPSDIYMSRILLDPGQYDFFVNDQMIDSFLLEAGDKKFILHWTRN